MSTPLSFTASSDEHLLLAGKVRPLLPPELGSSETLGLTGAALSAASAGPLLFDRTASLSLLMFPSGLRPNPCKRGIFLQQIPRLKLVQLVLLYA